MSVSAGVSVGVSMGVGVDIGVSVNMGVGVNTGVTVGVGVNTGCYCAGCWVSGCLQLSAPPGSGGREPQSQAQDLTVRVADLQ